MPNPSTTRAAKPKGKAVAERRVPAIRQNERLQGLLERAARQLASYGDRHDELCEEITKALEPKL